jgi:hypothetical protein
LSDELKISATFDASQLISGMEQATSAIKEGSSQITISLDAITAAGQGAETLLSSLGASSGSITGLTSQLDAAGAAAVELSSGAVSAGEGLSTLESEISPLSELFLAASEGANSLIASLNSIGVEAASIAPEIAAVGEQMSLLAVDVVAVNSPIADASGQLELFSEAAAAANGQLMLFQQSSVLAGGAAANLASAEALTTQAFAEGNIAVAEGVVVNERLASVIEFLNSKQAVSAATSQQVAAAWEVLNAEAEKLNLRVVKTASGFEILNAELAQTQQKLSNLELALGSGGARLAAMELGMGRMAYAVGGVARAIGPLAQAFAIAFAPIIIIAMAEAIDSMIDRFREMENEIRKSTNAFSDFATDLGVKAEDMKLSILKAQDEVIKLHNLPTENKLKEALIENKKAAVELSRALADAGEKALELLERQQIGFFKNALTGLDTTKDIKEKIEPSVQAYIIAQQKVQQARLTDNADALKAAQEEVRIAREKVQQIVDAELKLTEERKKALANSVIQIPTGKDQFREEIISPEEAARITGPREAALRSLSLAFQEAAQMEGLLNAEEEAHTTVANAATEADKARRAFSFSEDKLKNAQKGADQVAQIEKKSAEDSFKTAESSANNEAAAATETGTLREKAELDADSKIMAARSSLTAALLATEQKHYEATHANLEQERTNIEKFETGDVRTKKLADVDAEIERVERAHAAEVINITVEGNNARAKVDADAAAKRFALHRKEIQDEVFASREKTREVVEDAREQEQEQANIIKSNAEVALREVAVLEQERVITAQQAYLARVAIYRKETTELKDEIEKQKASLKAQQSAIKAQIDALQASDPHSAALKELTRIYDQLGVAINKAASAQNNLNTEFDKDSAQAQITQVAELAKQYDQAFGDMANRFGGMVGSLLSGSDTFIRAWGRMVVQMEIDFVQSLLRMVAKHLAAQAAKLAATTVSQTAQTSVTATQESLRAALENTTLFKALKGLILLLTHHKAAAAGATAATSVAKSTQVTTEQTGDTAIAASNQAVATAKTVAASASTAAITTAAGIEYAVIATTNDLIITSYAGVAGAVAFTDTLIKTLGDLALATAAGIAASAEVLGFLSLGTASQGALLTDDSLVMAHAEELILPADISAGLQGLIASGGSLSSNTIAGGGGFTSTSTAPGGDTNVNVDVGLQITSMDSSDVSRVLMNNQGAVVQTITAAVRNGLLRKLL